MQVQLIIRRGFHVEAAVIVLCALIRVTTVCLVELNVVDVHGSDSLVACSGI